MFIIRRSTFYQKVTVVKHQISSFIRNLKKLLNKMYQCSRLYVTYLCSSEKKQFTLRCLIVVPSAGLQKEQLDYWAYKAEDHLSSFGSTDTPLVSTSKTTFNQSAVLCRFCRTVFIYACTPKLRKELRWLINRKKDGKQQL